MKILGIVTTSLMVVFIGVGVWLYVQNGDLKTQLTTAQGQTNEANQKADQANQKVSQANQKIAAATLKIRLLSVFFNETSGPEAMVQLYDLVKEINNKTITADYKALQSSRPGSDVGTKMLQDIVSGAAKDLK